MAAVPCAVFAARVEVTPVPMPQDIVTEVVATNFAFNVDCDSLRGIELRFLLDGCASNCLQVAFGRDEDGNGVLDVLTGVVSPSGKLTDTIAYNISDYPSDRNFGDPDRNFYTEDIYVGYRYFETFAKEKVLYPFGFGLSYTNFEVRGLGMESAGDDTINFRVRVVNTGDTAGKEVVQIYCEAPQGKLGKPARVLCAYRKTITLDPRQMTAE